MLVKFLQKEYKKYSAKLLLLLLLLPAGSNICFCSLVRELTIKAGVTRFAWWDIHKRNTYKLNLGPLGGKNMNITCTIIPSAWTTDAKQNGYLTRIFFLNSKIIDKITQTVGWSGFKIIYIHPAPLFLKENETRTFLKIVEHFKVISNKKKFHTHLIKKAQVKKCTPFSIAKERNRLFQKTHRDGISG